MERNARTATGGRFNRDASLKSLHEANDDRDAEAKPLGGEVPALNRMRKPAVQPVAFILDRYDKFAAPYAGGQLHIATLL